MYTACGIFFAYFTVLFIVPLALSRTKGSTITVSNDKSWLSRLLGSLRRTLISLSDTYLIGHGV